MKERWEDNPTDRRANDCLFDVCIAQKRLGQVSGHLAGSQSAIAPTEGDATKSSGRSRILEKRPDDVCRPSCPLDSIPQTSKESPC